MERSSDTCADPGRGVARSALALAAICAVGGVAYARSFDVPFVFDDWNNITENPFIRWTQLDLESVRFTLSNTPLSRPVSYLSFALNHLLGGYGVAGYHAVNLAIHLANGGLVLALARVTLGRLSTLRDQASPAPAPGALLWLALASALVFVAHPIQTQSVTYVVQRMNALCAFFYLAALLLFVRGRLAAPGPRRAAAWALALLCGALALGSKENAATLPFAVWLYDWYFLRDLRRERRADMLGVALVALCIVGFFARGGFALLDHGDRPFTLGERLLTQPRVIALYVSLIALPLPSRLNLVHDVAISRGLLEPPTTLVCLAALLALGVVAAALARRRRLASFAILWFLLHLAIESSVFPLELVFEHRSYLPLVGICLALTLPLARLAAWRPRLAIAATAGLVAALTAGTLVRNETWRSEVGLWTDAVEKSPLLPRAHMNLGVALARAGRHEEAIGRYERALALDPSVAGLHYDLSFSLAALGRADEAELQLDETLRLAPEHAGAQHLKGEAALRRGELEEAIERFRAALRANTRLALSHYRLGGALLARGELEEAGVHLQAAGRLDPQLDASARRAFAVSSASRGLSRLEQGDALGATQDLRAALAADPEDAIAANGLAWILATNPDPRLRDPQEAQRLAELARRAQPEEPAFIDTLGAAYASAGRFAEAVATLERADALAAERGDEALRTRLAERLRLYRAGQPFLEEGVAAPTAPP